MESFEVVIGLEVHTQLKTEAKIFCTCSTNFDSPANNNICPVCCGYPGVLPVLNKRVLELAVRVCLALNCKINKEIYFERKNYFYPDLPKNYQISQYQMPLGKDGYLELESGRRIRINRVHLEEDAGKLIHQNQYSLVDFNRTGIPLLEIVSEPDISSPQEAFNYLGQLKLILQYIDASDCDMEKGSLRCDANISLKKSGATKLGTKVELKNMNTFKGVRTALEFETGRQRELLTKGETIKQDTRLWDAEKLKTLAMRSKEEAHDYRYFPEPDLLNFSISDGLIEQQKNQVGELPLERGKRYLNNYPDLDKKEVDILINNYWLAGFFEKIINIYPKAKEVSNWLIGPFLEQINSLSGDYNSVKISPQNFSTLIRYFSEGKLNNLTAKKVLSLCITTNDDINDIIEREKLTQLSKEDELEYFIDEIIKENPKPVQEYREGKSIAIQFLLGQVMKKTKGKANPKIAKSILERRLSQ
ncbi:MAG: Asp-tRNA(Asn)/Glu-tRNA(Gln) amidotransferase subunit GatB [Candidatus Omnitrophica bacterium]|jgi:aspartyl-tRNA(Asn)/glutamyl-tRNA(Gln) amidotransferase subunit B|nr:Asp-tRNA(Asn)/Glu-tRNA(Gln) amidotransferase subunit GatB [Candidatus Omnitrophota bacterium]